MANYTSASDFESAVASQVSDGIISATTEAAIQALLGDGSVVATWDGTSPSVTAGASAVVLDGEALASSNTSNDITINLPDAALATASVFVLQSNGNDDGNVNLTVDLPTSAEETVLVTGAGNDIITTYNDNAVLIEGGAGNDSVTTAGGNDTIVAGDGNDTVNTGDGYDTVQLAGSASDYTFSVTDGVLTATHSTTSTATTTSGDTTTTTTTVTVDSTTTITNAEILTFGDGSDSTVALVGTEAEAEVVRLYETLFDRSADASGADYWLTQLDAGTSLDDIATYMMNSSEYTGSDLSDAQFVEALYENSFGRAGDYEGVSFWLNELSNGTTRAEVVADFASSQEAQDASVDVMPVLIVGTDSSAS